MKPLPKKRQLAIYTMAMLVVSLTVTTAMTITMNKDHQQPLVFAAPYEEMAEKRMQMRSQEMTSSPTNPTTSSEDGGFTAQDVLTNPHALVSTNLVNTKAIYEIHFVTKTAGVIHDIEMEFPAGTGLDGRSLIERVGIGPGNLVPTGNTLIYQVANPVNVPAGTFIRLEFGNILNPLTPVSPDPLRVILTTKGPADTVIDGPTQTSAYFMRNINTAELADGAVTGPKIRNGAVTANKVSPSFMVSRILNDGQNGWNPDTILIPTSFTISDAAVHASNSHVYISVDEPADIIPPIINVVCMVEDIKNAQFQVVCDLPPAPGSKLRYTVINQP